VKPCVQFFASVLVLTIFLFQRILHLWQQFSSTFGQGQVFLHKTFSASSVTTGMQCFAMSHHLCKVRSAGCEMKCDALDQGCGVSGADCPSAFCDSYSGM